MSASLSDPNPAFAWSEWDSVRSYINKNWDPKNNPHHSIIGLTGAGKSYLAIKGILSLCDEDRVLLIDSKEDDELLCQTGKAVREIPRNPWYTGLQRRDEPQQHWHRLVVHDERDKAQPQVYEALNRVYKEGNWVVYIDEVYDITGARNPSLNLGAYVERLHRKGRSRGISVIGGTQSPAWVPRSFYDQASFAYLGRIRDQQRQKRLLEIGGMDRTALPIIGGLQNREWLVCAGNGQYFARTMVK